LNKKVADAEFGHRSGMFFSRIKNEADNS